MANEVYRHTGEPAGLVGDYRPKDLEGHLYRFEVLRLDLQSLVADIKLLDRLSVLIQPEGLEEVFNSPSHVAGPVRHGPFQA